MNNKGMVFVGVVVGIVFLIIGYVYATRGAGQLPSFFPGYSAGVATVHTKHAIASFIVGAACLVFAWFQSGPRKS